LVCPAFRPLTTDDRPPLVIPADLWDLVHPGRRDCLENHLRLNKLTTSCLLFDNTTVRYPAVPAVLLDTGDTRTPARRRKSNGHRLCRLRPVCPAHRVVRPFPEVPAVPVVRMDKYCTDCNLTIYNYEYHSNHHRRVVVYLLHKCLTCRFFKR
ncbi:hypothetical protein T12_16917, partial [Trichinella patagoniensis]